MSKEFRDPIHAFIRVSADELRVLDSVPVQRLREIHQLAMTYMVYPGATHRRFEHSLGVMHVAGQIFDAVTDPGRLHPGLQSGLPLHQEDDWKRTSPYWKFMLRLAALCHDIGHLPFSHGAEVLLPDSEDHEYMTQRLLEGEVMSDVWSSIQPRPDPRQIARIATNPDLFKGDPYTIWEDLLNQMIAGKFFGADRIDYLLRDSYHAGVAYGRFDIHRLIQSLRILPESDEPGSLPVLGIEHGGLRSAEQLLLARYAVFDQIYFHHTRRSFDLHLREFLKAWVEAEHSGQIPTGEIEYLQITDVEIMAAIRRAARKPDSAGHSSAKYIVERRPHRLVWSSLGRQLENRDAVGASLTEALEKSMLEELGWKALTSEQLREKGWCGAVQLDSARPARPPSWFPVLMRDGRIRSADAVSELLTTLPQGGFDFVFVRPEKELTALAIHWVEANRETYEVLTPGGEGDDGQI